MIVYQCSICGALFPREQLALHHTNDSRRCLHAEVSAFTSPLDAIDFSNWLNPALLQEIGPAPRVGAGESFVVTTPIVTHATGPAVSTETITPADAARMLADSRAYWDNFAQDRIAGIPREEIDDGRVTLADPLSPEDRERIREYLAGLAGRRSTPRASAPAPAPLPLPDPVDEPAKRKIVL